MKKILLIITVMFCCSLLTKSIAAVVKHDSSTVTVKTLAIDSVDRMKAKDAINKVTGSVIDAMYDLPGPTEHLKRPMTPWRSPFSAKRPSRNPWPLIIIEF